METGRRSFLSFIAVTLSGVKCQFAAQTAQADSPGPEFPMPAGLPPADMTVPRRDLRRSERESKKSEARCRSFAAVGPE